MAKKQTSPIGIDPETMVELISIKNEKVYMKVMKYDEALKIKSGKHPTIKKKDGWKYIIYQLGFSQYKDVIKIYDNN